MFDLYNTLIAYEGLLKNAYSNHKSKINNINLMREIKKTVEKSPEFYLEHIGEGSNSTKEEATKFFEKWVELCYSNDIKFNKSIFLNGFANKYEYLLKSKYSTTKYGLISKSQLNPDNPNMKDILDDAYLGIIEKISYKGQLVYCMGTPDNYIYYFTDAKGNFVMKNNDEMLNEIIKYYQNNIDEYNRKFK